MTLPPALLVYIAAIAEGDLPAASALVGALDYDAIVAIVPPIERRILAVLREQLTVTHGAEASIAESIASAFHAALAERRSALP